MKIIKNVILFVLSVGWLIPLYFSFQFQFSWLNTEVAPIVYHKIPQMNSFPLKYYSQYFWTISFFWMCAVIIFWFCTLLILFNKMSKRVEEIENKPK